MSVSSFVFVGNAFPDKLDKSVAAAAFYDILPSVHDRVVTAVVASVLTRMCVHVL
jgi:hypothetical protein